MPRSSSPRRGAAPGAPAGGRGTAGARAAEASGAPQELLGPLPEELSAAADGERLEPPALLGFEVSGRRAAEAGVPLHAVVDLYLTAARLTWDELPAVRGAATVPALRVVGSDVLCALDDAVAALCQGYQQARRAAVRAEEALRREFVDDLLAGTSDLAGLVERGPSLGLRLEAVHVVLVVSGSRRFVDGCVIVRDLEELLLARAAAHPDEPDLLVATKAGQLVCVLPAHSTAVPLTAVLPMITRLLDQETTLTWRLAVSRARPGAAGVRLGFEESRAALEVAERLHLPETVVRAEDLLIYQVLFRDREAMRELIRTVLVPLQQARGGAQPLLDTLRAYLATGAVAVHTARRIHLSVRAVTYRMQRVRQLTGLDPTDPDDRFVLDAALRGARMLGWPENPL